MALLELDDLREEIEVRWDWITPNEKVYVSASRKVGPGEGKYYPKVALAHAMSVDREDASSRPGLWTVEVYIDGTLKEARKFNIEPGLATLRRLGPSGPEEVGAGRGDRGSTPPAAGGVRRLRRQDGRQLLYQPPWRARRQRHPPGEREGDAIGITAKLKDYLPNNLETNSTLYVYFAGHGMPDVASGEPYLMLFDSEATNVARTGYKLKQALADIGALKIRNAFLFTDACFSGMAARGDKMLVAGARPAVIRVDDIHLAAGKIVAMGATTGGQLSHAYYDKRHGLFTYYLLAGLQGQADATRTARSVSGSCFRL